MKTLLDYEGKSVRLTAERLAHIKGHPEMADMEAAIEETLAGPELVIQSLTDSEAHLNYRYYYETLVGNKWLCVVVKYQIEDAFVITAYLTDKPKKGEQIWPSR